MRVDVERSDCDKSPVSSLPPRRSFYRLVPRLSLESDNRSINSPFEGNTRTEIRDNFATHTDPIKMATPRTCTKWIKQTVRSNPQLRQVKNKIWQLSPKGLVEAADELGLNSEGSITTLRERILRCECRGHLNMTGVPWDPEMDERGEAPPTTVRALRMSESNEDRQIEPQLSWIPERERQVEEATGNSDVQEGRLEGRAVPTIVSTPTTTVNTTSVFNRPIASARELGARPRDPTFFTSAMERWSVGPYLLEAPNLPPTHVRPVNTTTPPPSPTQWPPTPAIQPLKRWQYQPHQTVEEAAGHSTAHFGAEERLAEAAQQMNEEFLQRRVRMQSPPGMMPPPEVHESSILTVTTEEQQQLPQPPATLSISTTKYDSTQQNFRNEKATATQATKEVTPSSRPQTGTSSKTTKDPEKTRNKEKSTKQNKRDSDIERSKKKEDSDNNKSGREDSHRRKGKSKHKHSDKSDVERDSDRGKGRKTSSKNKEKKEKRYRRKSVTESEDSEYDESDTWNESEDTTDPSDEERTDSEEDNSPSEEEVENRERGRHRREKPKQTRKEKRRRNTRRSRSEGSSEEDSEDSDLSPPRERRNRNRRDRDRRRSEEDDRRRNDERYRRNRNNDRDCKNAKILQNWNLKFSGEGKGEPEEFLAKLGDCRQSTGMTDRELLRALPCTLTKPASLWYRTAKSEISSWRKFKQEFRHQFIGELDDEDVWEDLRSRTQAKGEKIANYITCFRAIIDSFKRPPSVSQQLRWAYRNLLPEYRKTLRDYEITSFAQLQRLGRKHEKEEELNARYTPPPPAEKMSVPAAAYNGKSRAGRVAAIESEEKSAPQGKKREKKKEKQQMAAVQGDPV